MTSVPNVFGTKDWFSGRQFFHRAGQGDGSGGNTNDGERWGAACEALLAHLLLTSCGTARGRGAGGVGDPCPMKHYLYR